MSRAGLNCAGACGLRNPPIKILCNAARTIRHFCASSVMGPELAVAQAGRLGGEGSFLSAYFYYNKPDKLIVEETTPTEEDL